MLLDKKIENQISFLTQDRGRSSSNWCVSPYVSTFLKHGLWSLRLRWMWRYKVNLRITADQSVGIIDIHYLDKRAIR